MPPKSKHKGHVLTDEDREKAVKVKEAARELAKQMTEPQPEKPQSISEKISELEEARGKRRLRALEENELLAIELENKRMRDELTGRTPEKTNPDQKSELDIFKKVMEMQKTFNNQQDEIYVKIKDQVVKEMTESDAEPEDATSFFLKIIGEKIASGELDIRKQEKGQQEAPVKELTILPNQSIPQNPAVKSNRQSPSAKSDDEVMAGIPDYLKEAIKTGQIKQAEIIAAVAAQKKDVLTDTELTQIDRVFKKIKNKKEKWKKIN